MAIKKTGKELERSLQWKKDNPERAKQLAKMSEAKRKPRDAKPASTWLWGSQR